MWVEAGRAGDRQVWGKQLVKHINQCTFEVGDRSTHRSCTVGVCAVTDIFGSLEELVAATIEAHRMGREAGGNTAFLNEAAHEDTKQKEFDAIWVKRIKAALMEDRFRLAKLPIAGLRSDSVERYVLVVRMLDEQGSSVLPSQFLPAAERNNVLNNIHRC